MTLTLRGLAAWPILPRMKRLLAAVLAVLLLPPLAGATLVVLVPSADGLVVAADSRISILGAQCDGQFKIVRLTKPARTVVMVTGDALFVQPPGPHETDFCHYVEAAPRLLDIAAVARGYLEQNSDSSKPSLEGLGQACAQAAGRFRRGHPDTFQPYAGKEIFSVIVASYDPGSRVATMRNFVVRIHAATHEIQAGRFAETTVKPEDRRGVWTYGETGYVDRNVYAGFGRKYLAAPTLDFILTARPVGEVPMGESAAAAVNILQAASTTTHTVLAASGIGGPIEVVLLGRKAEPEQIEWVAR